MKITYKKGTCSGCGEDDKLIVQKSLKLCQLCNIKRLQKRYNERRKLRVSKGEKADKTKLQGYYKEVWDLNDKECYETGEPLYVYKHWHVHHVLHKEDYPQLAFNTDISVLLTLQVHAAWHDSAPSDRARRFPKTYAKYRELCEKYNIEPQF